MDVDVNLTELSFFCSGYLGATACVVLSNWGSAWGTWKAGLGVCNMGVNYPQGVIKNIVPIVMAGVLGIYGLIVAVIIAQDIRKPDANGHNAYSSFNGYAHVSYYLRKEMAQSNFGYSWQQVYVVEYHA